MKIIIDTKSSGFSLVETLVAISILMIAISGPLSVANKAFTSALDARNQTIASNLAQEGLEYLNNKKDNNAWGLWDAFSYPQDFTRCTLSSPCNIEGLIAPPASFNRYFYITLTESYNQIIATVVVTWATGNLVGQIQTQEVLTNFLR